MSSSLFAKSSAAVPPWPIIFRIISSSM
jgi:hypothetical protein